MKRRILSAMVAILILLSMAIMVSASTIGYVDDGYVIVEDDMLPSTQVATYSGSKVVTVSEIQKLLDERTAALIDDDVDEYDRITALLREYGVGEATYEEIAAMLGENPEVATYASPDKTETTTDTVFEYYYTTYAYRGVKYDVMRILASPNVNKQGNSVLYQTGSKVLHNSKPAAITAINLFKLAATSLIGETTQGKVVMTLADVWDAVSSGVSTSTTVTNVQANYTWSLAEDCSWIYVSNQGEDNYKLSGRYHKASVGISVATPTLVVNNMNSAAYVQSVSNHVDSKPTYYDSTYQAVKTFASDGGLYESYIESVPVTGVENQTVATIRLKNPFYPMYAR